MSEDGLAFKGLERDAFPRLVVDKTIESPIVARDSRFHEVFRPPPRETPEREALLRETPRAMRGSPGETPPIFVEDPPLTEPPIIPIPDETTAPQPGRIEGTHRLYLNCPVAPGQTVTEETVFESPPGDVRYALPRYALATDRIGAVDEPRIVIVDRGGVDTLVLTLVETPGPASAPGVQEMPHVLAVTLRLNLPVLGGGTMVQEHRFPVVLLDEAQTTITAELPLAAPGLRQQLLAAMGSLEAAFTLIVGRGITVGMPTGQVINGPEGLIHLYREYSFLLDWIVLPAPLVLSDQQRARLGGGGEVQPVRRVRVDSAGRSHAYWQDAVRPELFYFAPDRFLLARSGEGAHRPLLRVSAANATSEADLAAVLEFAAHPVVENARLMDALPKLEEETKARGGTGPVRLERLQEAQSILRLALPRNGAPSETMTERPDTEIDLERGIVHAERLRLEDFRLVYDALFGASFSVLRGEVRVGANGPAPEDIPLELRLDRTTGDLLSLQPKPITGVSVEARLTNPIESPVQVGALRAGAVIEPPPHSGPTTQTVVSPRAGWVPLTITGLPASGGLAPGAGCDLVLTPDGLPGPVQGVVLDQSGLVVEPDRAKIWELVFDRSTDGRLTREVRAEAVPEMFTGPGDRVNAFVLTVENGGSASLTATTLAALTYVRVPVQPLLTGSPLPPVRYRTETHWASGGIGTSAWRETDATILFPVRTPPA
ncbi:hypothetical protein [Amycolatopsis anabasis]|uniref:hypothetical protein n=1 Tax=Amycolatopsis anabasis TaxID=1840409 RepID=UPI00131DBF48|nr:hypothetical protein [Amycolatopsis anabasis]